MSLGGGKSTSLNNAVDAAVTAVRVHVCQCACVPVCMCACVYVCQCASVPVCMCASVHGLCVCSCALVDSAHVHTHT